MLLVLPNLALGSYSRGVVFNIIVNKVISYLSDSFVEVDNLITRER